MNAAIVRIRENVRQGESMKTAVLREMVRVVDEKKSSSQKSSTPVLVTKNEYGVC